MKPQISCENTRVKYMLYCSNAFLVACGLGLLIPGIVSFCNINGLKNIKEEIFRDIHLPSIPLLVISVFIIIIAIVGVLGAMRQNYWITATYVVFLVAIFIYLIIIGGFYFLGSEDDTKERAIDLYKKDFQTYATNEKYRAAVDGVQAYLNCCGLDGKDDFKVLFNNETIPLSCCPFKISDNKHNCTGREDIFQNGCAISIVKFLRLDGLRIMTFGIAAVVFVGVGFALYFIHSIENERYFAQKI